MLSAVQVYRLLPYLLPLYDFQEVLDHSEVAALLITAAIHDLDHPARTNPYLCNTRDDLAILYNDT